MTQKPTQIFYSMKTKIRFKFFLSILLICAKLAAQDITGLWKGEMYVDSVKLHLPYEILISENKGKLTGYSRVIFFKDGVQGGIEEPGIQDIIIKQNGDRITIEDEGFLEHNFSIKPPKQVKKTMVLTLIVSDTDMVLKGSWSTNRTKYYLVATGTAALKRKNDYKATALYKRLDTLKLTSKLTINLPVTKPLPTLAITTLPSINTALPKVQPAIPEPDLIIPAIDKVTFLLIPFLKPKQQQTIATIKAPSLLQKAFYKSITTTTLVYLPKEAQVALKPALIIASATVPKPKQETLIVATPTLAQKKETKTIVAVPATPKPTVAPAPSSKTRETAVIPVPKPKQVAPAAPVIKIVHENAKATVSEIKTVDITNNPTTAKVKPLPEAVIAPSVTQGAAELDKRTILSEQSFFFESDSLVLTLYDNGDVDGDTVTVVMNGNVIFSKQGLSTRANTKTIIISPTADSVKLVMYAENLGEIPPNTGLLVVMDGEKRYDVRFAADLKSNAAIVLRRRKKQ